MITRVTVFLSSQKHIHEPLPILVMTGMDPCMCPNVTGGFRQIAGGTHPSVVLRLMRYMKRNRLLVSYSTLLS